jgi:outer membrane protein TolC
MSVLSRRRVGAWSWLLVLAGSLVCGSAMAAEPALSLADAVRLGVARAPLLEARTAQLDAARDDAIRAGRLPDPELTFGINNLPVTGPDAGSLRADMMTMRTIGVMQRVPSGASRTADRTAAQAQVQAAQALHAVANADVRRQVAAAWVALWAAQRERALLGDLRAESNVAVAASKARLAGGTGSAADALATRAQAVALDNRIDGADADIDAARAGLARWLGDTVTYAMAAAPDFSQLPVPPTQLLAHLDRQAPLLAWSAREQTADAKLAQARAGKHPDWRVGVGYGVRSGGRSDMLMLEVGVSLPLFAAHRQDPAISAAYADRDAVQFAHEDARRAQTAAVQATVAQWKGWTRQVRRYRGELLPLARDRSRTALAAYGGGGAPLNDWLDARRDDIATRIAYADALAAWGRAWVALAYLLPGENTP